MRSLRALPAAAWFLRLALAAVLACSAASCAFAPMAFAAGDQYLPALRQTMPDVGFTQVATDPPVYAMSGAADELVGYAGVATASGYAGPVVVAVFSDPQGRISKVEVLESRDWPQYMNRVLRFGLVDDLIGRSVGDPLTLGQDIDAVTGATFSSRGIANSVRQAARAIADEIPSVTPAPGTGLPETPDFGLGAGAWAVVGLWAVVILGVVFKKTWLRWVTLAAGLAILGFWLASPLTFASLVAVLMGQFPPLDTAHLVWYLVFVGVIATILIWGRNLYCYWVCPFGGLHEFLAVIIGGKGRPSRRLGRILRLARPLLVVGALALILVTGRPTAGSYEPFGTLFSRTGSILAWVFLGLVLAAGLVSKRFWCRYLCPVGYSIDLLASGRRKAAQLFRGRSGGARRGAFPGRSCSRSPRGCPPGRRR